MFCNAWFADRGGLAASRFLAAATAAAAATSVILLHWAAESRESNFNGSVRRVNSALAADFFAFGSDEFPFKVPFEVYST